jgi:hypothetical protein
MHSLLSACSPSNALRSPDMKLRAIRRPKGPIENQTRSIDGFGTVAVAVGTSRSGGMKFLLHGLALS